ncbi:hypothetical protein KY290_010223 [Solanum tuberosum]|uniref:Uncharacterized protein n=1 Tax=Solanum tuberosum TaxID=4113 RepID=A0ABQ7VYE6_SOLTU|nr:hypothetical protein KY289_010611 [Solanum tuberosum]KAH0773086.1 hypothetical protein KY290_010223 [Solanum tuberosum]
MTRAGLAKARQDKAVIVTRSWLNKLKAKCWRRAAAKEIAPQWQARRGRTSAHDWQVSRREIGRLKSDFGAKVEGSSRVPRTCVGSFYLLELCQHFR